MMGRRRKNERVVTLSWDEPDTQNAEAYACVKRIMDAGCKKKDSAVREAAAELKVHARTVWTRIRAHEEHLKDWAPFEAEEARQMRIALGEEKPTDEEIEAAGEQYIQRYIDLRRGGK